MPDGTHSVVAGSQQPPEPQLAPAQQGSPGPPQARHTSFAQARVASPHTRPGQQAWPAPPHGWQAPFAHASPALVQVWLAQQAWPAPPHTTHWLAVQVTAAAVHWVPPQHACMPAPQPPQLPFAHTPPNIGQVEPEPVHRSFTQQPPPLQLEALQQASPGSPQWVHTPALGVPVQTSLASQVRPGQQTWPAAPHAWQTPPTQVPPVQAPAQQGEPSAPQPLMSLLPPPMPAGLLVQPPTVSNRMIAKRLMMPIVPLPKPGCAKVVQCAPFVARSPS
jgi:hypothetical protein